MGKTKKSDSNHWIPTMIRNNKYLVQKEKLLENKLKSIKLQLCLSIALNIALLRDKQESEKKETEVLRNKENVDSSAISLNLSFEEGFVPQMEETKQSFTDYSSQYLTASTPILDSPVQKCKEKAVMLPRPTLLFIDESSDMEDSSITENISNQYSEKESEKMESSNENPRSDEEFSTSEEECISIGRSNSTIMNSDSEGTESELEEMREKSLENLNSEYAASLNLSNQSKEGSLKGTPLKYWRPRTKKLSTSQSITPSLKVQMVAKAGPLKVYKQHAKQGISMAARNQSQDMEPIPSTSKVQMASTRGEVKLNKQPTKQVKTTAASNQIEENESMPSTFKVPVPDTAVPMKRNKLTLKKNTAANAIKASCNPPKAREHTPPTSALQTVEEAEVFYGPKSLADHIGLDLTGKDKSIWEGIEIDDPLHITISQSTVDCLKEIVDACIEKTLAGKWREPKNKKSITPELAKYVSELMNRVFSRNYLFFHKLTDAPARIGEERRRAMRTQHYKLLSETIFKAWEEWVPFEDLPTYSVQYKREEIKKAIARKLNNIRNLDENDNAMAN